MNRIKLCFEYPKKNMELCTNSDMKNFITILGERMLPVWCSKNLSNTQNLNLMHNLLFLFAYKTAQVF